MLKNAVLVAKFGFDTAANERRAELKQEKLVTSSAQPNICDSCKMNPGIVFSVTFVEHGAQLDTQQDSW